MTTWTEALEFYLQCRTKNLVTKTNELSECLDEEEAESIERSNLQRWQQLKERRIRPLQSRLQINDFQVEKDGINEIIVRIKAREWYAYQLEKRWHEQEKDIHIRVMLRHVKDRWLIVQENKINGTPQKSVQPVFQPQEDVSINEKQIRKGSYVYNRLQAVRYAEVWWNEYNPNFRHFDVDCTNFISQCLYAGGVPFYPTGNRATGWWYRGGNSPSALWSYSWTVAHSFRWYLERGHIKTESKPSAEQLSLGDVICYDFDGDGRWQHSTIVVAKDSHGMPLVNAHTTNSRHRYWDYRDSTAYTPKIKYRFFHIM